MSVLRHTNTVLTWSFHSLPGTHFRLTSRWIEIATSNQIGSVDCATDGTNHDVLGQTTAQATPTLHNRLTNTMQAGTWRHTNQTEGGDLFGTGGREYENLIRAINFKDYWGA